MMIISYPENLIYQIYYRALSDTTQNNFFFKFNGIIEH